MSSSIPQLSPVRCFFIEIQERITTYDGSMDLKFRLLGNIVGFSSETKTTGTLVEDERRTRLIVNLDDGTALIQIIVTTKMVAQLKVQEGSLIECIAVVRKQASSDLRGLDRTSTFSLIGEQVAVINDANAETIRWMELCFKQSNEINDVNDSQWHGYPTRSITAEDLFRIIEYQCEFETDDSTESKPKGVSTEQLKICFDLSSEKVQEFLNELQTEGMIYKNMQGLYCKL